MQILSPSQHRGWVSAKSAILSRVPYSPSLRHRMYSRRKAECLHEITKSMVEVSLVAARHSAQLRSQRSKVSSGVRQLLGAEDGRVLGVLGQLGADETYDGKVGGHIRRGLDAVTQLFGAVQVAEAEVARARERGGGEGGGEEDEEDEELFKLKRERARLAKELADIEGGSRT